MKNFKSLLLSGSTLLLLAACGTEESQQQPAQEGETAAPTEQVEDTDTDQAQETDETDTNEITDTDETSNTEEEDGPGIENRTFEYSLDDVVQIFFDTFPEAEGIDEVEFERENGRFEYEIDGFNADTEFELTIDAETGEILEQKSEADADTETAINFNAILSPQEAMDIALEDAGTGYVEEWELEVDDGRTEYEIDIEGAEDRDIDAETGEIVDP